MSGTTRSKRPAPLSIRFTEDEKALLSGKAGNLPLGTFIKHAALGTSPARAPRRPDADTEALGQILAMLGASRIANNLNQLAKAANLGALPVSEETEADLREACAFVGARQTNDGGEDHNLPLSPQSGSKAAAVARLFSG